MTLVLLSTFILSLHTSPAHAALESASPDFQDPPPKDSTEKSANDEAIRQTIDIAKPPPLPPRHREDAEYFYPYRKAITVHAGPVFKTDNTDQVYSTLGVLYLFPFRKLQSLESGAELLSDGTGALHLAKRFILSRSSFRPYWKIGAGVRVVPSEQLTTFIQSRNYEIRGAGGFEFLLSGSHSIRVEAETNWSTIGSQLIATLGYVWAW